MKKVKKMAAGGYPAISVGVPGTPTYKRQTPTGKISTTPPPVSPPKGGPVRPTPPRPVRPTPPPPRPPVRPTPTSTPLGGGQIRPPVTKPPGGVLVGFGPTDAPIYSTDPNAVPYTGPSLGGNFVNGVPVSRGVQQPTPARPTVTPAQLFQMINPGQQKAYMKNGGSVKKMASGGKVSSASKRADGIATKGKTRGKIV